MKGAKSEVNQNFGAATSSVEEFPEMEILEFPKKDTHGNA